MTTAPLSSTRRATLEKFWFASVMETRLFVLMFIGKPPLLSLLLLYPKIGEIQPIHCKFFMTRGGQNLYGSVPRERARGRVCKKGEIKRVIKGGRLRLLCFSRKGVKKCRQNPITQAGAAARDPVREERNPLSGKKPITAIRAAGNWKCWTFPKSRVSICQSPMSFYPPSSVTEVRSRR